MIRLWTALLVVSTLVVGCDPAFADGEESPTLPTADEFNSVGETFKEICQTLNVEADAFVRSRLGGILLFLLFWKLVLGSIVTKALILVLMVVIYKITTKIKNQILVDIPEGTRTYEGTNVRTCVHVTVAAVTGFFLLFCMMAVICG